MTIIPAKYQCDICGKTYDTQIKAERCESKGIIQPILKVGDIINFCDCKDTPIIWFEDIKDSRFSFYFKHEMWGEPYFDSGWAGADSMLRFCVDKYCNKKIKIELKQIIYETPHIPTYRFWFLDSSSWFSSGGNYKQLDNRREIIFEYPTLRHDELLLQLDKYNPDIKNKEMRLKSYELKK